MLKQNQDNISIRKEDEICYGQKIRSYGNCSFSVVIPTLLITEQVVLVKFSVRKLITGENKNTQTKVRIQILPSVIFLTDR